MSKPVGGRGKKAPYSTVVLRIPEPLLEHFEQQIEDYRKAVIEGNNLDSEASSQSKAFLVKTDLPEALEESKRVLKSKISKEKSIAKLLQVIYGVEINAEDLK